MMKQVTPRQRQILQVILQHIDLKGYPPTVREIGEAVHLSSSSTVHAHLRSLEESGLIKRDAILTRAIKLLPGIDPKARPQRVVNLPIVGRVAAGKPTLAAEDIHETYPLPADFLAGGDGFMLEVHGESMIEDGIHDSDLVIVRRQPTAENGDVIVALIENEATIKRFYRENGTVRLQPANSTMEPNFADDVAIIGKVVGLVRKM